MSGILGVRRSARRLALAASMAALAGSAALAQETPRWSAHGSVTMKGGTERHIGELDVFVPVWQTNDLLLFADIRAQADDSINQEGNVGFGARWMRENWILGGYGFFDYRRSDETGNAFMQGTLGAELLLEDLDLRANLYLPENREEKAPGATDVSLVGGSLQMRTGTERALPGLDGEIGFRLWQSDAIGGEIRAFAGGFYFDAEDYEAVSGTRARMEGSLFDVGFLGAGSRVTLGAEVQRDTVRGTQAFVVARLTVPFGGGRRSGRGGLERRMTDYVVRDVDIVTRSAATGDPEALAYARNGIQVGAVTVLTGGVLGSADLGVATAGSAVGDMVIADGSAGAFLPAAGVSVAQGVALLGGGGSIDLVGVSSGTRATYTAPGTRPFIAVNNPGFAAITVTGSDAILSGLDIQNLSAAANSRGILTGTVNDVSMDNNNITTSGDSGYGIQLANGTGNTISGNTITVGGQNAFGIYVQNGTLNTISGNDITATGNPNMVGMWVVSGSTTMSNNNILVDSGVGFGIHVAGNFAVVTGNTITTNGASTHGINVFAFDVTIDGNRITTGGSTAHGVFMNNILRTTLDNNRFVTGMADANGINLAGVSDLNTGTGNSYSGPATACIDTSSGTNTIDIC